MAEAVQPRKKLRIFYASDDTPNDSLDSKIWRINLLYSLQDLGHDVITFDYDLKDVFRNLDPTDAVQNEFIKRNRPITSKALLSQITQVHAKKPIDFFFSYFYDACVTPETIDSIRTMGIKTINWFCNGSYQLHLVREISPHYDYCLVPEQFRLDDYRALGANPVYFQEAANPKIYRHYPLEYDFDVSFVGQNYGNRAEYIRHLANNGIKVRAWGSGWRPKVQDKAALYTSCKKFFSRFRYGYSIKDIFRKIRNIYSLNEEMAIPENVGGNPLSDEEMIKMYSRTKINLGFSVVGNTYKTESPIKQVRLRDFEIPMSGGFYLTEYVPELELFYEVGKEIVCFMNKDDLLEKVQYYLANPMEREKIRLAGYVRAQRDHTWQKRFTDLFAQIEEGII